MYPEMNPETRADDSGFVAPLDLSWSRPVVAVPAPRSQDMRIKYMFIAQRYIYRAIRRSFSPVFDRAGRGAAI